MDSVVVSLSKLFPGEAAGDAPWCSCPWPAGTMLVSASLALGGGQVPWISVASSPLLPYVLLEERAVAFPRGTNAMPIRCGTGGAGRQNSPLVVAGGTNRGAPSSHPRRSAAGSVSLLGLQVRNDVTVRQRICSPLFYRPDQLSRSTYVDVTVVC
jgi:hypothetical protein